MEWTTRKALPALLLLAHHQVFFHDLSPFSAIVSIECNNVSYLTADSRGRQLSQWRFRAFDDGVQWPSRSTYIIASSHCMTVLWRRRRSKVHSSLIFCTFLYCIAYFFHSLGIEYRGQKNYYNNSNNFVRGFNASRISDFLYAVLSSSATASVGVLMSRWLQFRRRYRQSWRLLIFYLIFSTTSFRCFSLLFRPFILLSVFCGKLVNRLIKKSRTSQ